MKAFKHLKFKFELCLIQMLCVSQCTHTYIYTYITTYVFTYIYACMYTYMFTCMQMYRHTHMHTCKRLCRLIQICIKSSADRPLLIQKNAVRVAYAVSVCM